MSKAAWNSSGDLPKGPTATVLRAKDAEAWRNGYSFLAEASRTSEQIRQEARAAYSAEQARGYQDGRAEGAAEATRLLSETTIKIDRYFANLDQEIGRLVMDIVRRVLGEFDVSDLVSRAAAHAIGDFRGEKSLTICVHPEALERVRTALGGTSRGNALAVTVESDPQLLKDGCVIRTEFAVVDASIETQLAVIAEAFGLGATDLPAETHLPAKKGGSA
jgi:type III secretion protein L